MARGAWQKPLTRATFSASAMAPASTPGSGDRKVLVGAGTPWRPALFRDRTSQGEEADQVRRRGSQGHLVNGQRGCLRWQQLAGRRGRAILEGRLVSARSSQFFRCLKPRERSQVRRRRSNCQERRQQSFEFVHRAQQRGREPITPLSGRKKARLVERRKSMWAPTLATLDITCCLIPRR